MATAPTPGRARASADAPMWRIRVKEQTLDAPSAPTIQEKIAVRYATGLPLEAFWRDDGPNVVGEDSLMVLWWLARRFNGEPKLAFGTVADEWPSPLTEDDIDFSIVTGEEDEEHPEDSGPV